MTVLAPNTSSPTWVVVGDERVRVDHIIRWRDDYYNGWQHYLTVTLSTGKEVRAQVTPEQWGSFQKVVV